MEHTMHASGGWQKMMLWVVWQTLSSCIILSQRLVEKIIIKLIDIQRIDTVESLKSKKHTKSNDTHIFVTQMLNKL